MKSAVVYWSGTGNTEIMAKAIAGERSDLFTSAQFSKDKVGEYEALALGCPSMGAEELEDTEFLPMYEEIKPLLKGKKVAIFGSYDWGDGEWLRLWKADLEEVGAVLIDEPLMAHLTPEDDDIAKCKELGEKL